MPDYSTQNPRNAPIMQYVTPTTGSTVNVTSGSIVNVMIDPAGTLLTLTLTFPSSPSDGDLVRFAASQIVTTFTMSGGTVVGALTTLAVATFASYCYSATASKWFRCG